MLTRIIYLSSAINDLTDQDLMDLLQKSRDYNLKHNITGVLFHVDGNFIQIIEGEDQDIQHLYHKISLDYQHKNLIKVIEDHISTRQFDNWLMGYNKISWSEIIKLEGLENYKINDLFKNTDFIAKTFITTFLKNQRIFI
jgi:hypothetical protein